MNPERPVEHLGEAIADLAARMHAATYELLVMLRQFDEQNGWNTGFMSCAHWLSWRTGIDMGAAREKVRVAKALAGLPRLGGALQRGEISYAKVRALTRVATPANEERLLRVAYTATASQVERVARAWRRCDRLEETLEDQQRRLSRSVTTYVDEDGMVVLRARLTPELGAVVQRALDAAAERLYQESKDAAAPASIVEEVSWAQRRADALGLLAESALQADLDRGSSGDRYQVVLHVEGGRGEDHGQAAVELEDGAVRVSAETSQRLACDASVVMMRETAGAASPAAPRDTAMPITSLTGRMAVRPRSTT